MNNKVARKSNGVRRILNLTWALLTILLLTIATYYQWQQYRLQKQDELQVKVNQLAVKLDHLIDMIQHAGYSLPLYGRELKECQHDLLPILQKLNSNNAFISGSAITNKSNQIICSTLSLAPPPLELSSENTALYGPIFLNENESAFILQQHLGQYLLNIYIQEDAFTQALQLNSTEDQLISIYDEKQQKENLHVGNKSLTLEPDSINTVKAPLQNLPHFKVILEANPLKISKDFIYKDLPLALVIMLISFLFYYKFRALLNNRYSLHYALTNALRRNHFQPMYQPIRHDLEDKYCGAEVLLRWKTDSNEIIMPDSFIDDAEKSGLIVPITLQLMEKTFQQSHDFIKRHPNFHLAFNLSANHFSDKSFFSKFYALCNAYKIPAQQVMLELTERELLDQNNPLLVTIMRDLRNRGYSLAIDDFGVGYSNLGYLKLLPFDFVKIDRSFVTDFAAQPQDAAIVAAMIALAHTLKMRVIGEGVERRDQFHFLCHQGCDEIQGYLLFQPMPSAEVEKVLNHNIAEIIPDLLV